MCAYTYVYAPSVCLIAAEAIEEGIGCTGIGVIYGCEPLMGTRNSLKEQSVLVTAELSLQPRILLLNK